MNKKEKEKEEEKEKENKAKGLLNEEENKAKGLLSMFNKAIEEQSEEQSKKDLKPIQSLELPLKMKILLKLKNFKNKVKNFIPVKGKQPTFIAYLINNSIVERVKVYESVNNQFFEYQGTEYYLNRNRTMNLPYEKHPALIYKKGVSEPIDTSAKNLSITFSNELSTAVEGTVIDQFNSADINIDYLETILKMTVGLSFIAIILSAIILFGLIQNGIIFGG